MVRLGFFPSSYAATGNGTHISSVAPLLRNLNQDHFTNRATVATTSTYPRGKIGCSVRETEVSLRSKRNMPFPGPVLPLAYQVMVSQYASDEHIDKK